MVNRILKLAGFLSVFTAILLFSNINFASASAAENLRGWANNSTYGYISFNCLDDGYAGHFTFTFPFVFNIGPCAYNNHGVNLDDKNNFSGDAWNSVLGFITFNATSTPLDDFRTLCNNGNTCTTANSCTACYNEGDQKVYGYMKVVSTGEWIRLDNTIINPTTQMTNYLAPQPGIFSGYATSSFGSISFNCSDSGTCGTNDYKVRIGPLEIRQMVAPNWGSTEACTIGANHATLKWNRRSGTQTAYQVIVSTSNSTSTGVVVDSGQINNASTQFSFVTPSYDTPYYWFLRLWDETGAPIAWRQFNTSGTKDWITDNFARNSVIGNSKTFASYKHEFPRPNFSWTPSEIIIATTTNKFISSSVYYNSGAPTTPQACSGVSCIFSWATTDSGATILSPTASSTSIMFTKATSTAITLTSTDPDAYVCSTSTILNVNYALPLWKEIKAPN